MSASAVRRIGALSLLPVLTAAALAAAPSADAASTPVVISEAYGGGGNSGAMWRNDFVELFNRSAAAVDLTGWKLQYFSTAGTTATTTTLSGSIGAGRMFLVQEAAGANTSATALPTPDATGTTAMSASGARLALLDDEFSTTADLLVGSGSAALVDLPRTLPPAERWSYVFEGNSQVLDHILVSRALTVPPKGAKYPAYVYDIVHTNSAFPDQDSDHEPQVVRLALRGGTGQ